MALINLRIMCSYERKYSGSLYIFCVNCLFKLFKLLWNIQGSPWLVFQIYVSQPLAMIWSESGLSRNHCSILTNVGLWAIKSLLILGLVKLVECKKLNIIKDMINPGLMHFFFFFDIASGGMIVVTVHKYPTHTHSLSLNKKRKKKEYITVYKS
jgi:hypothetical protein